MCTCSEVRSGSEKTATGEIADSRQARMLRTAISPPHAQARDQLFPRLTGFDDLVDEPAPGCDVGGCELGPKLRHPFGAIFLRIRRPLELVSVQDVHGAFRTHYGYLRRGVGKIEVGAN